MAYQNQQSDNQDNSEDDDFYESEKAQPRDIANSSNDSNGLTKGSLVSRINVPPLSRSAMASSRVNAATTALQPQDKNVSTPTQKATNPKSVANKGSDARLTELREKLLANKRASSATPLPSSANKTNDTTRENSGEVAIKLDEVHSSTKNGQGNAANANAWATQTDTARPRKESLSRTAKAPKSPSAHADIQGLIDEYRVSELAKDTEQYSNINAKGYTLEPASKSDIDQIPSGSRGVDGATLPSTTTNVSQKCSSESPGSSESGEIRSELEHGTATIQRNISKGIPEDSNIKPLTGPESKVVANTPIKSQGSNDHGAKQKVVSATPKPNMQIQTEDLPTSMKSTPDARTVPLAPKTESGQKVINPSPASPMLPGDHRQSYRSTDLPSAPTKILTNSVTSDCRQCKEKFRSHTQLRKHVDTHHNKKTIEKLHSKPAAPVETSSENPSTPSQASQQVLADVAKYPRPSEQVMHDERGNVSKQQISQQHQQPTLPQAILSAAATPSTDHKESHRRSRPVAFSPEKLRPNTAYETHEPDAGSPKSNILSLSQQEQIQKLEIDLTSEGLRDLYDFLEYHRFFVDEYREGFLARQKRLRALEAEKIALERESIMQYELFNSIRAKSLVARETTEAPALVGLADSKETVEKSLTERMPPPLSLPGKPIDTSVISIKGRTSDTSDISPKDSQSRTNGNLTSPIVQHSSDLKRQRPDDDDNLDRSWKLSRVDIDGPHSDRSQQVSPRTSRNEHQTFDRRRTSDSRLASNGYSERNRSPVNRRRSPSPYRQAPDNNYPSRQGSWTASYKQGRGQPVSSGEGMRRNTSGTLCHSCDKIGHFTADCPDVRRGSGEYKVQGHRWGEDDRHDDRPTYSARGNRAATSFRRGSRGDRGDYQSYKPSHTSTAYKSSSARYEALAPNRSESLNLKAGESRYFMVKSWNAENVEAAQRDCIWATQPKNLDVLTQAFNTCRNVILVFSVNQSRAFQGYARMQSLPSPDIPAPEWQKALLWPSTDPFRIEWITVAETRFHCVGHLKNALNEGQAVLIGRDGQEIEEKCGRELCELVDEAAREQARYDEGY
ncbi:MAG: hypothetical protein Q9170_006592 [Blastenia crenularia]